MKGFTRPRLRQGVAPLQEPRVGGDPHPHVSQHRSEETDRAPVVAVEEGHGGQEPEDERVGVLVGTSDFPLVHAGQVLPELWDVGSDVPDLLRQVHLGVVAGMDLVRRRRTDWLRPRPRGLRERAGGPRVVRRHPSRSV